MQIMPYEDGIVGQIIMGNESAEFLGTIQGSESYGLLQETGSEEVSAYHAVVRGNQLDFTITVVDPSTFQSNEVTLNFKRGTPSAATSIATTHQPLRPPPKHKQQQCRGLTRQLQDNGKIYWQIPA